MAKIGRTDKPAKRDEFYIDNYISGLSAFLNDCVTPMTIAVQGEWGSGKTSIMELVRERIKKDVQCIWFNTWQFSQFGSGNTLALAMIESLVERLKVEEGKKNAFLEGFGKLTVALLQNVAVGAIEVTAGSSAGDSAKEVIRSYKSLYETIKNLKTEFQKCVDASIKNNKKSKIVIFIDDLDRLEPVRAVELLEILKIFFDCENCVFVIAIDYDVVVTGVQAKYNYNDDIKDIKGKSFFDKIIQVPFKMPVPQYDIQDFVKKEFELITKDIPKSISKDVCYEAAVRNYASLILTSVGRNPRSIKRIINSYLLLLKIVGNKALRKPTSYKALFAIVCMQHHFESLYNFIVINSGSSDIINAEFFNNLADEEACTNELSKNDIINISESDNNDEVDDINKFMKCFNNTLSAIEDAPLVDSQIDELIPLLQFSAVTKSDSEAGKKKRSTFQFNGKVYQSMGAEGKRLYDFALHLILDYSNEVNKTQDSDTAIREFLEKIDKIDKSININPELKRDGLGSIVEESHPGLSKSKNKSYYFTNKDEKVLVRDKTFLVLKGWSAWEIISLINVLGYNDGRVISNMDLG